MKMPKSLIIDPQFKNLIPPLQRTEYLQLEEKDRKSTRLNSSHIEESRMPSSA